MTGIILVAIIIAINCGFAFAITHRHHAIVGGAHEGSAPDQRRARWLLAFNLVVLAAAATFVAMRP